MKNKFTIFVLISVSLALCAVITGHSKNHNEENVFAKSLPVSDSIVECKTPEEKKEVTVYITKTGKKYHRGSCRYLKKSKIKISLKEACKRGYGPCKVCKPPICPEK